MPKTWHPLSKSSIYPQNPLRGRTHPLEHIRNVFRAAPAAHLVSHVMVLLEDRSIQDKVQEHGDLPWCPVIVRSFWPQCPISPLPEPRFGSLRNRRRCTSPLRCRSRGVASVSIWQQVTRQGWGLGMDIIPGPCKGEPGLCFDYVF